MAAPAPMTMEPSIDDSDMSGNFKLNGAGSNKVLYYAPFHKNFGKFCGVIPSAYWMCLRPRSFHKVMDDLYLCNLPFHNPACPCAPCMGDMCIKDLFAVKALDKLSPHYTRAENCTPFHQCYFCECNGEVAVTSPFEACTGCFCRVCFPAFQCYEVGLQDATAFSNHMNAAILASKMKKKNDGHFK